MGRNVVHFAFVLAMALFSTLAAEDWINDWDQRFEAQCGYENRTISQFKSIHDDNHNDRRYGAKCRYLPGNVQNFSAECYWTDYLNQYDGRLDFNCGKHGYINGIASRHNNYYEDRKWQIRCCELQGSVYLVGCSTTDYTNEYQGYQRFDVPTGRILSGVHSIHSNKYEDRRWKFRTCNVQTTPPTPSASSTNPMGDYRHTGLLALIVLFSMSII